MSAASSGVGALCGSHTIDTCPRSPRESRTMRALLLNAPRSLRNLAVGELSTPEPGAGQVRIRVEAVGLNPVDARLASGEGHPDWEWPHVLGLDIAGVVDATGAGVERVAVGDRVANHGDLRRQGGLAEYVIADQATLAQIPSGVSSMAAAALPCAGMAAYQAVHRRLHVEARQTVLVTGAAGGVGGFAVQLAAFAGARVIGTASSDNHDWVRALGATDVVDYKRNEVSARVLDLTDGRGVDAVVDTVSAESATDSLGLLVHAGGIACIAGRARLETVLSFTTAPSLHEIALGAAHSFGDRLARQRLSLDLARLLRMVNDGWLDPMITGTVALEHCAEAFTALAAGHNRGKVIAVL